MSQQDISIHGQWSTRWAFFLAATGSAVGLGNVWKFPYITGENGGGAFVLVYLACVALIGVPVMIAEVMLGRRGRESPINTMRKLATAHGRSPAWSAVGYMGVLAGIVILSFYSVIAGWTLAYAGKSATGAFTGASAEQVGSLFGGFLASPGTLLGWHTLFIAMTTAVVARGVSAGLERSVRILMPALLAMLLVLVGYGAFSGGFARAAAFLFSPDFERLSAKGLLTAMGHAFFTLSLGMGAIMAYGAYLSREVSITRTAFTISVADTLVALLAGLAIFPLVFANGLSPGQGPGLIFEVIPVAFGQMPGGALFGTVFFLLLAMAAWTSAISLIEPGVAWLVERLDMGRRRAALTAGLATWTLGVGSVLSFNLWAGHTVSLDIDLGVWRHSLFRDQTFFGVLDYLTANVMLPLGGLLIVVFAAWGLPRGASSDELGLAGHGPAFRAWHFVARYVTPVGVLIVFLGALGLIA